MTPHPELTGGWTVRLADSSTPTPVPAEVRAALPIPATVPGCVHTDLLAAGLIPDPYLDRNELSLTWIGRVAWVYERVLEHDGAAGELVTLTFEGLDTIATITINGEVVARTENMHRRYDVAVPLLPGSNLLAVRFDSAWEFGEAERNRLGGLPCNYPGPFNFLRKMACNFGWDWGPTLVTAGIWRPVRLRTGPSIRAVRPHTRIEAGRGIATFDIDLDPSIAGPVSVTVGPAIASVAAAEHVTVEVVIDNPGLWWPRGLGDQIRYDAVVRAGDDEWRAAIGFRTIRLDTEPDAGGTPFTLVVNDVPVPVRGANWIPDDCFPSRITEARLRERLGQAVDANINLLRVWGGGVYESRDFYRLCDELGILVWQDFLFACAAYPEDERLAGEIEAEARDNVERLLPHPSLVLWNGNNENIWGFFDWGWQDRLDGRAWGLGYYLDLLPRIVAEVDPSRPYWPGSPYSGSMAIHPNDDDHGPKHVWDVWNTADYPVYRDYRPRFVAEFGWQGPPAWSTLTRAIHDEPLTPESPGMLHHQKAVDGNGKLERGLTPHFAVPSEMDDWHWAMQLNQARAVRFGIEHFRSLRPRCSGTIVWQLNDCWPVTSWAAVDGDGRKKPLWYALRAAYAPRLLTIQPRDGGLALIAINDTRAPWRLTVPVRRMSFDGKVLASADVDGTVPPLGAFRFDLPATLATPATPESEVLVAGEQTFWFFAEDRDLAYPPASLKVDVSRDGDAVVVAVTTESLVRDLCLFPDRIAAGAEAAASLATLLPGGRWTTRVTGIPAGRESELLVRTANDLVAATEG